jgi:uncharacterized phage protein (TIGR02218 family)
MSKSLSAGLTALLAADSTIAGLARAFVITRKDDTVVRVAEVTDDTEIGAHVFSPVTGVKIGSIPIEINPSGPGSLDVEFHAFVGGPIDFEDVRDGLYANATCSVCLIDRNDPDTELDEIFFGDVGEVKFSNLGFVEFTVTGPLGRARDYINDVYQAACRARFTSTDRWRACNVSAASVTENATVVSVSGRNIVVSGLSGSTGKYNLGLITLTSGRFENHKREIRTSTVSGNTTLELYIPFGVAPEVGVTMTVRQGCSHDLSTTQGCPFYSNIVNYRGEPYIDADAATVISQDAGEGA